jgi:hypothetical protein
VDMPCLILTSRTGRWRTQWVVDQAAGEVSGTIQVDVHYFEQGNVSWLFLNLPSPADP